MPLASNLLSSLFIVLSKQGSEENEYVMKGIVKFNSSFVIKCMIIFFSNNENIFYITRTCDTIFEYTATKIDRKVTDSCKESF